MRERRVELLNRDLYPVAGDPSWTDVDRHAIGCACAACAQTAGRLSEWLRAREPKNSAETSVRKSDVVEIQKHLERIEGKLDALEAKTEERFRMFAHVLAAGDDRLEAKLQIIQRALKSGAIGAWGNP